MAGHTLALPGDCRRGWWQCRQSCRYANSAAVGAPKIKCSWPAGTLRRKCGQACGSAPVALCTLQLELQVRAQEPLLRREIAEFGHPLTQEGDNFSIGGWGGRASRLRRRRAPGGGAHGTPKGTRPARNPEEDRAMVAGAWLVLEDLSLVQFELYEGTGWNPVFNPPSP